MMSNRDIRFFEKVWAEREKELGRNLIYVEYGTGGSTAELAPRADHVYAFESNKQFCDFMMKREDMRCLVGKGKVSYRCIIPTRTYDEFSEKYYLGFIKRGWFQMPSSPYCHTSTWRDYIYAAPNQFHVLSSDENNNIMKSSKNGLDTGAGVDLLLVDGRFRLAVALSSLLWLDHDVPVLIHDAQRYLSFLVKYFDYEEDKLQKGDELKEEWQFTSLALLTPRQEVKDMSWEEKRALVEGEMTLLQWESY